MGKKSSKAPDTKGAAEVEGEYGLQAAREQIYADRANQFNPFGSSTWTPTAQIDPSTGKSITRWTQQQTLSPQAQALFDQDMERNMFLGEGVNAMNERIASEMSGAPDWTQFGEVNPLQYDPTELRQQAEDSAYQRATARLDPQFESQRNELEIRLRNRGLRPGDQAYEAEMSRFDTGRNDAYEMARLGATQEGRTEAGQLFQQQMASTNLANALRDQQIQEYINKRGFSLNEANALKQSQNTADMAATYGGG